MDPLTLTTIGMLGTGTAKAGFGVFSAFKQRDAEAASLREQLRRMRLQNEQTLGKATALGASDEFGLSGSLPAYIQRMGEEMNRQLDFARRAGQRESSLNFAGSIFGAATDFGGSILRAGEMNRWWLK